MPPKYFMLPRARSNNHFIVYVMIKMIECCFPAWITFLNQNNNGIYSVVKDGNWCILLYESNMYTHNNNKNKNKKNNTMKDTANTTLWEKPLMLLVCATGILELCVWPEAMNVSTVLLCCMTAHTHWFHRCLILLIFWSWKHLNQDHTRHVAARRRMWGGNGCEDVVFLTSNELYHRLNFPLSDHLKRED